METETCETRRIVLNFVVGSFWLLIRRGDETGLYYYDLKDMTGSVVYYSASTPDLSAVKPDVQHWLASLRDEAAEALGDLRALQSNWLSHTKQMEL